MRKSYLALAVPAFLLGYFFSPSRADAVMMGGCNQNCVGAYPGHCEFYYQPFFCLEGGGPIECEASINAVCEPE